MCEFQASFGNLFNGKYAPEERIGSSLQTSQHSGNTFRCCQVMLESFLLPSPFWECIKVYHGEKRVTPEFEAGFKPTPVLSFQKARLSNSCRISCFSPSCNANKNTYSAIQEQHFYHTAVHQHCMQELPLTHTETHPVLHHKLQANPVII